MMMPRPFSGTVITRTISVNIKLKPSLFKKFKKNKNPIFGIAWGLKILILKYKYCTFITHFISNPL